jgi:hypothetical protein
MKFRGYHIESAGSSGYNVYKIVGQEVKKSFWQWLIYGGSRNETLIKFVKKHIYDSPYGKYRDHTDDQISYQLPREFKSVKEAQQAIHYEIDGF